MLRAMSYISMTPFRLSSIVSRLLALAVGSDCRLKREPTCDKLRDRVQDNGKLKGNISLFPIKSL
jgi:hypothetical protein